jgi:uncharacterized 2Fe-2S/4Fe-4S cluster protein (DUF4445 family)
MPVFHVRTEDGEREIPFTRGASLRDILATVGVPVRSGCGGMGACGLCLVRIEAGEVDPPTGHELRRLRPEQVRQGIRLACQVIPCRDLTLTIVSPPIPSVWRSTSADELGSSVLVPSGCPEVDSDKPLGVAVDLGTTHIRLTLWDMTRGKRLAGRNGTNPQCAFGADVMTRLMAACETRERAAEIGRLARGAIGEALFSIAAEEGCRLLEIGQVAIVGNSAMLALLAEKSYDLLLKPAYWTSAIDCHPEEIASWCGPWGIDPRAVIEVVPPLAGFIGSDLLASVLATRLTEGPGGALLIDFGTNSEIALWDGATLWTTSAAGGPAFEGCGISCGMPAEPGAIYRVEPRIPEPGFRCEVIGGGRAEGICGSGLVDIIAASLRQASIPNGAGRRVRDVFGEGLMILEGRDDLTLMNRDLDAFQRAKAAIGAGAKCLMGMTGMGLHELNRVCVCGAFGRFLHVSNAQAIGLLPEFPMEKVELCGDSALTGCERLLFSRGRADTLGELKRKARTINLAQWPEFEDLFVENLQLRPLRMEA